MFSFPNFSSLSILSSSLFLKSFSNCRESNNSTHRNSPIPPNLSLLSSQPTSHRHLLPAAPACEQPLRPNIDAVAVPLSHSPQNGDTGCRFSPLCCCSSISDRDTAVARFVTLGAARNPAVFIGSSPFVSPHHWCRQLANTSRRERARRRSFLFPPAEQQRRSRRLVRLRCLSLAWSAAAAVTTCCSSPSPRSHVDVASVRTSRHAISSPFNTAAPSSLS